MWSISKSELKNGYRIAIQNTHKVMSYREVLDSLKSNRAFREFFIGLLKAISYEAYRWETPGYTEETLDQDFDCVFLNAPSIHRKANSIPFESYVSEAAKPVVSFQNLGKDADLVVPSCQNQEANYCHLASFTRTASICQQHDLWIMVGTLGLELASNTPVWLSTAGGGVAWLHVRFDTRPKYYRYEEFKQFPNKSNQSGAH